MRNVYGTYQNVNRVCVVFFVKVFGTDPYISNCLRRTRHHALPRVCVCVFSCARGVCVCVFVCPHALGRCNDALFHRCIRRFTDSSDASIHSSIHQCIKCVRWGSFVILFRYCSICCAVVLLISGLFLVSFC